MADSLAADDRAAGSHVDLLTRHVEWFENAEEASDEARQLAERDRDYRDNKQWTDEEIAALNKRKQPVVTINRIGRKVAFLMGLEIQERTDPKAYPRTPQHEDAADAATDALRYVVQNARYDRVRSRCWENMLVEGYCGAEVAVIPRGEGFEITLRHVAWDRLFYDPHSAEPDFSDARYFGSVVWMDYDDAVSQWPGKKDILDTTISGEISHTSIADTYEDRPRYRVWSDGKRKRVRVVKIHWRHDGVWHTAIFVRGGYLEDPQPSPYLDEHGNPEPELILQSAYVDRDNNRYGVVREMISPQDEMNKRRSKALHLLNSRQVITEKGATENARKAQAELAKPDGIVEVNPGGDRPLRFEILPTGDLTSGQMALLQESSAEMDLMGPNAAMSGKDPRGQSGRAILAQQQGGSIELNPIRDNRRDMDLRVYRAIWNRIRQFQTAEWWVRVTDDEDAPKFVGLNQPINLGQSLVERMEQQGVPREEMRDAVMSFLAENGMDQSRLLEPVEVRNNVAEMDVDIILEDAPDTTNIQIEEFEILSKLAQAGAVPPDVLIEASSMRPKKRKALLDRLQGNLDPEAAQQKQQEAEQAKQLQIAGAVAEIEETEASAEQKRAQAAKARAEVRGAVAIAEKTIAETPPDPRDLVETDPASAGFFNADAGLPGRNRVADDLTGECEG